MRISEQIFPRCVVLVATIDKNGKPNVMTASFVMPISFDPKYVAFSISPRRHSFNNLREVPEFTLNIVTKGMKKKAEICGSYSGRNTNKFKLANLTQENSKFIKAPLIKESPVSFECRIESMKEFGDHFVVIGKVLEEYIRKKDLNRCSIRQETFI
jgi:flavin reductase (DIM6/NTAB) family NADH-FMN oxidoreductase RutF